MIYYTCYYGNRNSREMSDEYVNGGTFANWSTNVNDFAIAGKGVTTDWYSASVSSQANWRVRIWVYTQGSDILNANASIK